MCLHITAIRKFISYLSLFFLSFSLGDCLRHTELKKGKVLLLSFVVCLHITAIRKFMSLILVFFLSFSLGDCLYHHTEQRARLEGTCNVLLLSLLCVYI